MDEANKQQEKMVLFDSITGAIYGPNTNGGTGYVARAVAPQVSYQIGQYFKGTNGEGTAPHILAHGILAAAISLATGNDVTTGTIAAMGAEAATKPLAQYLFGTSDPNELTAEEKSTISSIISLGGLSIGSTTGDVSSAINAQQIAQIAVESNGLEVLDPIEAEEIRTNPNYSKEMYDAYKNVYIQMGKVLENKPFNLVYKINQKGDLIVCIPTGSLTCGLRPGEHYANAAETKKGNAEFLMNVVPIPGRGVKVVAKETGQVIGIYKDAKAANAAIQRARVEANIATSKATRESSNYAVQALKQQQQIRISELKDLFNPQNTRNYITIGNRNLIEMPKSGNAKIFSGASESEVKQYFTQLTGQPLPSPVPMTIKGNSGLRYTVSTPYGNMNLRNVSASQDKTGPAWTIDIPKGLARKNSSEEIKFLR